MNVLQPLPSFLYALPSPVPPADTSAVRACRTCHALFEPAAAARQAGVTAGTGSPAVEDERFCSKACRHDARRRGR